MLGEQRMTEQGREGLFGEDISETMCWDDSGVRQDKEMQLYEMASNTDNYTNRKKTTKLDLLIVETKQTEKKPPTEKTSTNESPRKTKYPGTVLLGRGAQTTFYVSDSKIVFSNVRRLLQVHFHVKLASVQEQATEEGWDTVRNTTKGRITSDISVASGGNPSLDGNTVLIPLWERSLN